MKNTFEKNDNEKSINMINNEAKKSLEINSTLRIYSPDNEKVDEFELFEDKSIEFITITTKVKKVFIRGTAPLIFYVFFFNNEGDAKKYYQLNGEPNLQFGLENETNENMTIYLIAFKNEPQGRILSEGEVKMY